MVRFCSMVLDFAVAVVSSGSKNGLGQGGHDRAEQSMKYVQSFYKCFGLIPINNQITIK